MCIAAAIASHPSWVCGLKLKTLPSVDTVLLSHPSWVCGLKLDKMCVHFAYWAVTPFVGVWIETFPSINTARKMSVTPFVGVWIETSVSPIVSAAICVTPFVGVWIETVFQ